MTNSAPIEELIQAVEQAASAEWLLESVQVLAARQSEAAIPTLIAVLGYNNPGAALAAVEGLISLGKSAVQPLLDQLDAYDYGARAYSIRALAAIADPRAFEVLVTAATDFAPSVRRAAVKGLGNLHWQQLPPQAVSESQAKAMQTLLAVAQDSDWAIRYAAIVGLEGLAQATDLRPAIQKQLEQRLVAEDDLAVRARIVMAQQILQSGASDRTPSIP